MVGHGLCFEFTESTAIHHLVQVQEFIAALKPRGCRFTLDNFGSASASLQCIRSLLIDFLKIEGGFTAGVVDDPVDQSVVEALLKVAHAQGIAVIAERVESLPVCGQLAQLGLDYLQGYQIGRPQPLAPLVERVLRE